MGAMKFNGQFAVKSVSCMTPIFTMKVMSKYDQS